MQSSSPASSPKPAGTLWVRECCRDARGYAVATDNSGVSEAGSFGDAPLPPDIVTIKYGFNGTELWRRFDGTTYYTDEGLSVATDGQSLYVAGRTNGTLLGQTGSGKFDAFVLKYALNGTFIWHRQFGSPENDVASSIIVTKNLPTLATDVYVAGTTGGNLPLLGSSGGEDYFLRKYDGNGNIVWTRQYGTASDDRAVGISSDRSGLYIVGSTGGTFANQTKSSSTDAFIAKYDFDGNLLWIRQFGSVLSSFATAVSVNSNGIFVGGVHAAFIHSTNAADYVFTSSTVPIVSPLVVIAPPPLPRIVFYGFVDKFDSDGNLVIDAGFETNNTIVTGISTGPTGVYATGSVSGALSNQTSYGGSDVFVRKFGFDLEPRWTAQFGTNETDYATGISVGSNGIYVSGSTSGLFPNNGNCCNLHNTTYIFLARLTFPLDTNFTVSRQPTTIDPAVYNGLAEGGVGAPYSVIWDFGDGHVTTQQSDSSGRFTVSHNYAAKGLYDVLLTVKDLNQTVASASLTVYVSPTAITAGFTFSPASPRTGSPVNFAATVAGGTAPYSLSWDFGDGSHAVLAERLGVSHVYAAKGSYAVTLNVTDSNGATATAFHQVFVGGQPLTVGFTYSPVFPRVGEIVNFTSSVSGGTAPYSFSWNFGDGFHGNGTSPSHSYTDKGTFTVVLTVTDSNGEYNFTQHSIPVASQPLTLDFVIDPPSPIVGQSTVFTATGGGGTPPYTFRWTFGDNTSATAFTVSHTYSLKGSYSITLTATDLNGVSATVTRIITLVPQPLTVDFAFSPSSPTSGQQVIFNSTTDGGTSPYSFNWGFGDSATGTGSPVTHTYNVIATTRVHVVLTATDTNGVSATTSHDITVAPLAITVTIDCSSATTGKPVTCNATASGGSGTFTFSWSAARGTPATGTGTSFTTTYETKGSNTITVAATDSNNATGQGTAQVNVTAQPIFVTVSCGAATAGKPVTCNASATGGTTPYTFAWSSSGSPPAGTGTIYTTTFAVKGTQTITATTADANGASQFGTAYVAIAAQPIVLDFMFSPTTPASGQQVVFTAVVTGGTSPYSFSWDFGDGGIGTGNPTTHVFTTGGLHFVTLSLIDSNNSHRQLAKSVLVISPPSAPQNLQATPGDAQIELSWQPPSSNGGSSVTHYRVYRGNSHESISFNKDLGNVFSYKDTGLTNGLAYYYQISAVNALGESSRSNEAFTTLIAVYITSPTPPTTTAGTNVTIIGTSLHADYVDVQIGNSTWHTQWNRAEGTTHWNATFQLSKINPSNGNYTIIARASNTSLMTSFNVTTTLTVGIYWVIYRPPTPPTFCVRCVFGGGIVVGTTILAVQQVLKKSSQDKKRKAERQSTVPSGSITYWNRLEPRQRSVDISENLAGKICDPLRMMTFQWQLGKFRGVDGGSPAFVEISGRALQLSEWRPKGQTSQSLSRNFPLERQVTSESFNPDYALRVELGQAFETLLRQEAASGSIAQLRQDYLLTQPATQSQPTDALEDGTDIASDPIMDPETKRFLIVCADRCIDGYRVYLDAKQGKLGSIGKTFVTLVENIYGPLPTGDKNTDPAAWKPERMDYALELIATGTDGSEKVLSAQPDEDADLEWYSFDLKVTSSPSTLRPQTSNINQTGKTDAQITDPNKTKTSVMPIHVRFPGMPSFRWWGFEDARIDFGDMKPDKRDLARLIFMDFMLIYSNDWFVVPFDQTVGSLYFMESFIVHDIFGTTTPLKRADADLVPPGQRWTMFSTTNENEPAGLTGCFLIPPTAAVAVRRGRTLEEVAFLRDEAASMAWAIEKTTENGLGEPWSGHERNIATVKTPTVTSSNSNSSSPGGETLPKFHLQTPNFPRNWFPLLPVATGKGDVALVRGTMLSETNGEKPSRILPTGKILNPSALDGEPLSINEEEVPRSGVRVTRQLCFSRWVDGSGHVWIARAKAPSVGEGRSGLQFDYIAFDLSR